MIKKLFIASLAALTLSCAAPKNTNVPKASGDTKETIQYNCYPGKHFAAVSYQNTGQRILIDHWGYDKNAGCFALYSDSPVSEDDGESPSYMVLFTDADCNGKFESHIDLSKGEYPGDLKAKFNEILQDLRDRSRTKKCMNQCLNKK